MNMANGISLHLGLNSVDPGHYAGWDGQLTACEADAKDMTAIARSRKFEATTLLTSEATRDAVLQSIAAAAGALEPGDIFLLTYSGHGGQLPDLGGDEDDGEDETWCLFDRQLVDDELFAALAQFKVGVRILVFSDSCHSGTVTKDAFYSSLGSRSEPQRSLPADITAYRFMPPVVALRVYEANKSTYDPVLRSSDTVTVNAAVLLISGCQDNQRSADGAFNGRFTAALRRTWNGGKFTGNYLTFQEAIGAAMPPDQSPNYYRVGAQDAAFENQVPFTIDSKHVDNPTQRIRARNKIMPQNAIVPEPSPVMNLAEEQRALQHEILRNIVEGDGSVTPETQTAITKLRQIYTTVATTVATKPKGEQSKVDPVLITFATIVVTAAVAAIIKGFEELLKPPVGAATIYNPGPPIRVWTYDETDGLRWIAYREYTIGTNEAVALTARGNNAIQVVVIGKPNVHTCAKGSSYAYDGISMQARTS
jgi:metacaspase-1